jgi:hypothetical protein
MMAWFAGRIDFKRCGYPIVIALGFLISPSHAMNLYRAGEVVVGESYNEVSKTWTKRELSVWAGVDTSGREVLTVRGDSSLGVVEVRVPFERKTVKHLEQLLTAAKEWAKTAEKTRAGTPNVLGCLPLKSWLCDVPGVPDIVGQMGLTFWSTNDSQRTSLIVDLVDGNSRCCKRIQIYVEVGRISSMIYNVKQLDSAMKKAKENFRQQQPLTAPRKTPSTP